MKTLRWLLPLVFLGMVFNLPVRGQKNNQEKIFSEVDQMPEFPGGTEKLKAFVAGKVAYPEQAKKEGIQGRVYVSFTVNKKGEVVDAKVEKGVHASLDKEAVRVVELMPAWVPGKVDGQPVNVRLTLPVEFKLDSDKKQ